MTSIETEPVTTAAATTAPLEQTKPAQPKIILHWLNLSRAQRIVWLLEELNVEYEIKVYKRGSDRLAPPELRKVHPLGTSPALEIQPLDGGKSIVLVESAEIIEYLTDYYGKQLVPARYAPGKEGQIGAESEEWVRYRHYMHYAEGSLFPILLLGLIMLSIKNAPVPFFLKPITKGVASRVENSFLNQKYERHFDFLKDQLATVPNGGQYLCGDKLTGADILMVFPLEAATKRGGLTKEKYPNVVAYLERLEAHDGFKRAVARIEKDTGEKYTSL